MLDEIRQQAPSTLQLTLAGLGMATVLGVPLGLLTAWRPRSWLDRAGVMVSLWGVSMPSFWLGMLLIFVFALGLGWLGLGGIAVVSALLIYEHSLVRADDLSRVDAAFFAVNGYVSVLFFVFWAADLSVSP